MKSKFPVSSIQRWYLNLILCKISLYEFSTNVIVQFSTIELDRAFVLYYRDDTCSEVAIWD